MINSEQDLVNIESAFETAKAERFKAKTQFDAAKGNFHMRLMARRSAGENLTISDMEAMKNDAINTDELLKTVYLRFIEVDGVYRMAKVKWDSAKREYWDSREKGV